MSTNSHGTGMNCDAESIDLCRRVRLGHAYWSSPAASDLDDVAAVLRILSGESTLQPRTPANGIVPSRAERLLNMKERPIYAFWGCLHPKLGTIGLIIAPTCLDARLQGVSRCDTGGLANRHGAFAYVGEHEVEIALRSLSFNGKDSAWLAAFTDELVGSYANIRCYVAGEIPSHGWWADVRARCIARYTAEVDENPDRRLWTWEARLAGAPNVSEFEGVVVSHEAFKRLEHWMRLGQAIPEYVKIVHGSIDYSGIHYFHEEAVIDLLYGADYQ